MHGRLRHVPAAKGQTLQLLHQRAALLLLGVASSGRARRIRVNKQRDVRANHYVHCAGLFCTRGTIELVVPYQITATALLATVLLGLRYVPSMIHQPQLVDALCEDLQCVAADGICALRVLDQVLRYACVASRTILKTVHT